MQVHPLYDINDRVWVAETGVVARTLRELQQKLPEAEIVGYYPEGYVEDRSDWQEGTELRKTWRPVHSVPTTIKALALDKEIAKKKRAVAQEQEYYARQKAEYERIQQDSKIRKLRGVKQVHLKLDREAVLNLRAQGKRTATIARELNFRFAAVSGCITEAKKAGDPRAITPVNLVTPQYPKPIARHWTSEQDEELCALVTEGWKDREIANKLYRTRNAIIGRRHRLGLESN